MKKVLIALLCFCFAVSCFSFPALAADTTDYKLYGIYTFNDTLSFTGAPMGKLVSFSGSYLPYDLEGNLIYQIYTNTIISALSFYLNGTAYADNIDVYNGGWQKTSCKTITIPVPVSVSETVYNWFSANSSRNYPRECDGILHPITDTDYDGTCELCGDLIPDDLRPSPPEAPVFDVNLNASYVYDYGADASLLSISASVSDGGTLSYQWYKNTSNSTTGGSAISGATYSSYKPLTTSAGTAYYYCKVTNTIGGVFTEAFSNVASVTVQDPVADTPVFDLNLPSTSLVYDLDAAADSLTVSASVSDGGTLSYQWCVNTSNSTSGGTTISGATGPTFTPPTSEAGTFYYFCRVVNSINGVSSIAYSNVVMVKVLSPDPPETPVFSLDLNPSYSYSIGDQAASLVVSASVSDGGTLFYQWYMSSSNSISSGAAIMGANSVSYVPSTSAAGTTYYYCMVTNTLNGLTTEAFSSVAAVVVSDPTPVICDGSAHSPYDPDSDYTCNTCGCSILESLRVGYYNYRGHWLLTFPYFDYDDGSTYDYAYLIKQNDTYYMVLFFDALYVNSGQNSVHYGGDGGYVLFQYDPDNVSWSFAGNFTSSTGGTYLSNVYNILWSKYDLLSSSGSVWIAGDSNFVVIEPEEPEDPGWTENTSNTLWGWLESLWTGLGTIWESITNLPGQIADLILSGIKAIFVPDMEEMKVEFEKFSESLKPETYSEDDIDTGVLPSILGAFNSLNAEGARPGDITGNINIGGITLENVTFASFDALETGVEFFRPIINSFLVIMMALFGFREFMSFIGQAPSMAHAANKAINNEKSGE